MFNLDVNLDQTNDRSLKSHSLYNVTVMDAAFLIRLCIASCIFLSSDHTHAHTLAPGQVRIYDTERCAEWPSVLYGFLAVVEQGKQGQLSRVKTNCNDHNASQFLQTTQCGIYSANMAAT